MCLAARGLPGVDLPLPARVLGQRTWDELLDEVDRQRLWGLLGSAVSSGALPASEKQAEQAEGRHRQSMRTALELEAMAVRTSEQFSAAGIPLRLLKGLAVAHLDEVDPALRCFNDVDILVRGEDLGDAVRVLGEAGYQRDLPERRQGYDRRFGKEVTLKGSRGRELDLHRTLALGGLGFAIPADDLWQQEETFTVGGRRLPALDADLRLLHACYAAILGDPTPRLVVLRDIALMLNGEKVDLDRVVGIALRWHGEAVVAAAVRAVADTFGVRDWPLLDWASALEPTTRSWRLLRCYRSMGGSNTRELLSGLLAPIPMASRAAYLYALVLPAKNYSTARRRTGRASEHRVGLRELLRSD